MEGCRQTIRLPPACPSFKSSRVCRQATASRSPSMSRRVHIIRQVHGGKKRIPSEIATSLAEHYSDEQLTTREWTSWINLPEEIATATSLKSSLSRKRRQSL